MFLSFYLCPRAEKSHLGSEVFLFKRKVSFETPIIIISKRKLLPNSNPIAIGNLLSSQLFFLVVGSKSYFPKHSVSDIQKSAEFKSYNS